MFDIKSLKMNIEKGEGPVQVTIAPQDLYPPMVERIQDVLKGANPTEILASTERGGNARADRLISEARNLPEQAWVDALRPRSEFSDASYFSFVQPNGRLKNSMMDLVAPKTRPDVLRMVQRGYALETAMGWFLHALRLEFGQVDVTIQPGSDEEKDQFRL